MIKYLVVFIAINIMVFSGCNEGGSGDTWVVHRGGVVCKGYNAVPIAGTDIYVSPNGNDFNSGVSVNEPLETLAKALCNAIPGQTVHIAPGVYHESILLSEFGNAVNPISIIGEIQSNNQLPILDGERSLTYGIAIIGEDEDHKSGGFIIKGLTFQNFTDAGIFAALADNVMISDCIIHDNGFRAINPENMGEGFGADLIEVNGLTVKGIEAMRNGPEQDLWKFGILGNDVAVWGSTNVEILNSYMHESIGGGLLIEDSVNVLVENNCISGNELDANGQYWDGAIWVDGGHNVIVHSNIIDNNNGPGIQLSDEGVQKPYGYVVVNNTITNNLWGIYIWNFGVCPWPDDSIVHIENNTFSGNTNGDYLCAEWECGYQKPCD